jgi:hypothetical protein
MAVLCDECCDAFHAGEKELRFACRGYPAIEGRVPFSDLNGEHAHDVTKHRELMIPEN